MSYEIVKSIKITDTQVILSADSNNVSPRCYTPRVSTYLTSLLAEKGKAAVILYILNMYEEGMMQPGVRNRYSRAIERLRAMPEYALFDWTRNSYDKDDPIEINRRTNQAGLDTLLLKAFAEVAA